MAIVVSYAGVVLCSRKPEAETLNETDSQYLVGGVLLCILGAVGMSLISVATKRIKDCHFTVIQFHYGWASTAISLIIMCGIYLTEGRVPFEGVYWSTLL